MTVLLIDALDLRPGDTLVKDGRTVLANRESLYGEFARWIEFEGGSIGHVNSDLLVRIERREKS